MTDQVVCRIGDFSSLLQISIALHLGYSLVREVGHATSRRFELHAEHLKRWFRDFDEQGQEILRPMIAELDLEIFKLDRLLEPAVRWMARACVLVAVYAISLLAYAAFTPDTQVPLGTWLLLLVPATVPFPFFVIVSYVIGMGASISAGKKSLAVLTEFDRLVHGGHMTGKGRYIQA